MGTEEDWLLTQTFSDKIIFECAVIFVNLLIIFHKFTKKEVNGINVKMKSL